MNTMLPWNALYTKPGCEEKAVQQLKKKRVIHYHAVTKIPLGQSKKIEVITMPIFPSIIFVQVSSEMQLKSLAKLSAFRSLAYWQNEPAIFPSLEIELLQDFVSTYLTVKATKLNLNDLNQMDSQEQEVLKNSVNESRHSINLPSIGYTLSAEPEVITSVRLHRKIADWQKIAESFAFTLGYRNSSQQ